MFKSLSFISFMCLISCGIQPDEKARKTRESCVAPKNTALRLAGEVTYERNIKPLFASKCVWCHNTSNRGDAGEKPLDTLDRVRNRIAKNISTMKSAYYGTGGSDPMPPRGEKPELVAGDVEMLEAWQAAGFPVGTPLTPPATGPVTYDNFIKEYLDSNCVSCHSPAGGEIPLNDFATAKASAKASLATLEDGSMPKGSVKVDSAIIDAFQKWIDGELGYGEIVTSPTERITYKTHLKKYFDANCVGCHSASGKINPFLDTFEFAKIAAEKSYASLTAGSMPPGNKASDSELDLFKRWMADELNLVALPGLSPDSSTASRDSANAQENLSGEGNPCLNVSGPK